MMIQEKEIQECVRKFVKLYNCNAMLYNSLVDMYSAQLGCERNVEIIVRVMAATQPTLFQHASETLDTGIKLHS